MKGDRQFAQAETGTLGQVIGFQNHRIAAREQRIQIDRFQHFTAEQAQPVGGVGQRYTGDPAGYPVGHMAVGVAQRAPALDRAATDVARADDGIRIVAQEPSAHVSEHGRIMRTVRIHLADQRGPAAQGLEEAIANRSTKATFVAAKQ